MWILEDERVLNSVGTPCHALHCHHLYRMGGGKMTSVAYL
jgi:hypothetical protein